MGIREELDAAWAEWMKPKGPSGKKSQGQSWREQNPGEWTQLQAYRSGGARPSLVTNTGRQMVDETAAWLLSMPPPPPVPVGSLGVIPNAGFPGTANGGVLAASLGPSGIREDHLSAELVAWAAQHNAHVLGVATGKDTAGTLALLAQYPTIRRWELDNEPYFPTGQTDAAAWARKMRDTAKAVKAKDSSLTVLVPLLVQANGGDYPKPGGGWSPWVTQILDAAPDLPQYVDGWAIHPYSSPRDASPQWATTEKVRGQLQTRNADRPFHVTEVGWTVGTSAGQVTLQQQADYIRQFATEAASRPWVESVYIYSLRSWGTGFEQSFGLFNTDGTERPSAQVFRDIA